MPCTTTPAPRGRPVSALPLLCASLPADGSLSEGGRGAEEQRPGRRASLRSGGPEASGREQGPRGHLRSLCVAGAGARGRGQLRPPVWDCWATCSLSTACDPAWAARPLPVRLQVTVPLARRPVTCHH